MFQEAKVAYTEADLTERIPPINVWIAKKPHIFRVTDKIKDQESANFMFTIRVFDAFLELLNEISDMSFIHQLYITSIETGDPTDHRLYVRYVTSVTSVTPRHATPCHAMPRHVTSRHVTSRHVTSVASRHVASLHVASRRVASRHVTSRHVTSRHVYDMHI